MKAQKTANHTRVFIGCFLTGEVALCRRMILKMRMKSQLGAKSLWEFFARDSLSPSLATS